MSKSSNQFRIKQNTPGKHDCVAKTTQTVSSKSIILDQNGVKKVLKKIKLKKPHNTILKLKQDAKKTKTDVKCKQELIESKESLKLNQEPEDAKTVVNKELDGAKTILKLIREPENSIKANLHTEHFVMHGTTSDSGKLPSRGGEGIIELIECEWCPETFTRLSKAIEHKYRKHNYESKNYFCTLCGKLFPLKIALEQHQNMEHKNDREMQIPRLDYICGFCGTAFICKVALDLHIKTAHNLEKRLMDHPFIPKPSKKVRLNQAGEIISIYYCYLCGSEYMVKYNLLKHIEEHHPYQERCAMPEDMVKCSTCDSMFYTKKAFDAHNVHHKPEDLYVTSEEHRLNIVARVDQDFDFQRVPTALDKAMVSISTGSDSAVTLAKKHRKKMKATKTNPSTITNSSNLNGKE